MAGYSLMVTICLTFACIFHKVTFSNGVPLKECGDAVEWIADLDDCSVYYLCVGGKSQRIQCGDRFSFSAGDRVCVPKDSIYDSCIPSVCQGRSGRVPHPHSCAMFYNCDTTTRIDETWEPRLRECKHPKLFNDKTNRCEPYNRVKCGTRMEPKSPCRYYANQCRRAHCVPCSVKYPSCEGLSNGLHPWKGREWSPFYVGCRQERVLFQKECPRDGGVQVFDPKNKKCVIHNNNYV